MVVGRAGDAFGDVMRRHCRSRRSLMYLSQTPGIDQRVRIVITIPKADASFSVSPEASVFALLGVIHRTTCSGFYSRHTRAIAESYTFITYMLLLGLPTPDHLPTLCRVPPSISALFLSL